MATTRLYKNGSRKLTDRERRFVLEYCLDYNGKRAAMAAGYTEKSAAVMARKLINKQSVKQAIGKIQRQMVERAELKAEEVAEQVAYNVRRDVIDLCNEDGAIEVDNLANLPKRIRCCVDGIKVRTNYDTEGNVIGQTTELKLVGKHAQIELAARMLGMLTDKSEVRVKGDGRLDVIQALLAPPESGNGETVPDRIEDEIGGIIEGKVIK